MNQSNRRRTLKTLGGFAVTTAFSSRLLATTPSVIKPIRLGMIADLHGGLAIDARSRLDVFLESMRDQDCDGLVQLGDFAYPNAAHQVFADRFNESHENTIHVIGNHEFDHGLTRTDCCAAWGIDSSYYRSDIGGLRILVLDGNERGSASHRGGYPSFIGKKQQEWLDHELSHSVKPILVLSHQPIAGTSCIDNASEIQTLLARHRSKIIACLNGHSHLDLLLEVDDVPYLHVNSASYFWVGGRTPMAYYTKPLFTTITLDPATGTVTVAPSHSRWKGMSPKELGYFNGKNRPPESTVTPQIRERTIANSI